uniref:uncharacterized protein LOC108950034 n=1 Tax=Ciona intestinalis TaxID=7719 RepID=UPI00089DCB4E|nr:uncharacterized protein LOC108950034 [Ciona intestinalis]|eukprot:XP_018670104.1 uncharacterized protein LOC108950034 [Ciona intestinalis]
MDCPAIVNESLQGNPIVQNLVALKFKIRLSSATFENSVIIPTSAVAFFLLPVRDVMSCRAEAADVTESIDEALLSKIRKFSSGHRNAYVILLSQQFSETEIKAHQLLQEHFMEDRTTVLAALSHKSE